MAPDPVPLRGKPGFFFKPLPPSDVARAGELETASYPADEAATPEKLEYRQKVAPELFYGIYEGAKLVGFTVSTAAAGEELEEETMSTHVPGGETICIHSVCVDSSYRRRGLAKAMVIQYVDAVAADPRCKAGKKMALLAHAPLLGLYAQCGFTFIGPSKVEHGGDLWYDMTLDLISKRRLEMVQVDAFTDKAYAGNPAAVLFTQRGNDATWMKTVAAENNLSETAFLEKRGVDNGDDASHWDIRWFTPTDEVDLCGHATLASAHALWDTKRVPRNKRVVFHTRNVGTLTCSCNGDWIMMDFPAQPPTTVHDGDAGKKALAPALGLKEVDILHVGRGPATTPDWLLEVTPEAFAGLMPDSGAISKVKPMDRGVIVTCVGGLRGENGAAEPPLAKRPRVLGATKMDFDFCSRFFAPTLGIPEDPVTGSAHCVIMPYWVNKLGKGKDAPVTALQASARGGILRVRLGGPEGAQRVFLEGQAVTVLTGLLTAD
eukprot:TRINITY_DN114188_c0_g1_i1.p1 TRINITY_DN114188_c0_g1~~TRINITY_DN114188_c0_g1_i1.p1  ORF type:complete len:490 (-),score=103.17 TRINITY_DN114188_c0_g1_i1:78-1547(-)